MTEITASAVKSLRDRTGAGMMDCKRALEEAGGDEERAIDLLRQRGAARAAKRAGREASEGAVHLAGGEDEAVMVEVLSETDFVAHSEPFEAFVRRAAEAAGAAELPDGEVLSGDAFLERVDGAVGEALVGLRAKVGENVQVGRAVRLGAREGGLLGRYLHFGNRIGVLVELAGAEDRDAAAELARELAMHIAATNPAGVSPEDIPEEERERERAVLVEQAKDEGKPPEIAEKIVEGRMRKFYEQNALLWQDYVKDPDRKVKDLLAEADGEVTVRRFVRFEVGD